MLLSLQLVIPFVAVLASYFVCFTVIVIVVVLVMLIDFRFTSFACDLLGFVIFEVTLVFMKLQFLVSYHSFATIFVVRTLEFDIIEMVLVESGLLAYEVFSAVRTSLVSLCPFVNARLAEGYFTVVA